MKRPDFPLWGNSMLRHHAGVSMKRGAAMQNINIDTWVAGCKVRAIPWVDGEHYYFNVQYYPPGSSLSRSPAFDKTVYITANERGKSVIECCLNTLVEFVSRLHVTDGNKYVLTFDEEINHRRLKDAFTTKSEAGEDGK